MLISAVQLDALMREQSIVLFDCRFDLQYPERCRQSWLAAHIPGAVYAHLDDDLAAPVTATSGRHPLPTAKAFADFLAASGWTENKPVVAYDAQGGAFAARLWWLMRYFGLPECLLLDGGIGAWSAAGLPMESGETNVQKENPPELTPHPELTMNAEAVSDALNRQEIILLDARAQARFNGDTEPLDTVAGHVPGAINHFMGDNLIEGRSFKPEAELKTQFRKLLGKQTDTPVVHMCGSGVTACHNLFAMELAGLQGGRLYPGSWSEWIRDPSRPVVAGKPPAR